MPSTAATDEVDLRSVGPALAAWVGSAAAVGLAWSLTGAACALLGGALCVAVSMLARTRVPALRRWLARRPAVPLSRAWVAVVLVVGLTATVLALVRSDARDDETVTGLAQTRTHVEAVAVVATDPRTFSTVAGSSSVVTLDVRRMTAGDRAWRLRLPVLAWAHGDVEIPPLGTQVVVSGRLAVSDDDRSSAELSVSRLRVTAPPAWWWSAAGSLRDSVAGSVEGRSEDVAALVPALVHGDDSGLGEDLKDDFRTSGLTHLLAVSGTNLTLLLAFVLAIARPLRAGARARVVLALLTVVGFVLLARPEPSVARAAAMGVVGVVGLSAGGRAGGMRCLSWAVVALVLVDPWYATSAGFILSVLATAGILLLAPVWRDALAAWMPRWCAEAIAVPAAAQLACTAPVAVLSGQVSLVAVVANLLAAPAVGPATLLGLAGGLVGLVTAPGGTLIGLLTAWPAGWIIGIGRRSADLPGAAADVGTGGWALAALVAGCVVVAVLGHRVLRRRLPTLGLALAVGVFVVVAPTPGWPPPGWVLVACDVGQGDATVVRASEDAAVVVDAGPDPGAVERCLDDLDVRAVPLVVLTHDHDDHTAGLAGVLDGRRIGWVGVGPSGPQLRGVTTRTLVRGQVWQVGDLRIEVLAPESTTAVPGPDADGSTINDTSVVLLVHIEHLRLLLTGDVEPDSQRSLLAAYPDLRADVLKVPHHGSAHQDEALLRAVGASWSTISVGADNTYGHPADETVAVLESAGSAVLRTDRLGDVALVSSPGGLRAVVRRRRRRSDMAS